MCSPHHRSNKGSRSPNNALLVGVLLSVVKVAVVGDFWKSPNNSESFDCIFVIGGGVTGFDPIDKSRKAA